VALHLGRPHDTMRAQIDGDEATVAAARNPQRLVLVCHKHLKLRVGNVSIWLSVAVIVLLRGMEPHLILASLLKQGQVAPDRAKIGGHVIAALEDLPAHRQLKLCARGRTHVCQDSPCRLVVVLAEDGQLAPVLAHGRALNVKRDGQCVGHALQQSRLLAPPQRHLAVVGTQQHQIRVTTGQRESRQLDDEPRVALIA